MSQFRTALRTLLMLAALAGVVGLVGCDALSSDEPPSIGGSWEASTNAQGTEVTLQMDLSDNASGSALLLLENPNNPQAATYRGDVQGTYDHPDVQLEVTDVNGTVQLDGTMQSEGKFEATMTFPSGVQKEVTVRRE